MDVNASNNQDACTKLCLMAGLQFQLAWLKGETPNVILAWAYGSVDRVNALCEALGARERDVVTEECQALKQESNNDKGEQALHIVDDLIKIYCSAGLGMQEANKYRMRALCNVQSGKNQVNGTI